jgi:hypothetical protein
VRRSGWLCVGMDIGGGMEVAFVWIRGLEDRMVLE